MSAADSSTFLQRTHDARQVMVLDLGMLGDTVHLLPALWLVRQSYPHAKLHVSVAAHITSLFECFPWVDKVWGYPRYPKHATLTENLAMIRGLRREKLDALINLNGSDRSSWLSFLSGARERLGRRPGDGGPWFWTKMFTSYVQYSSPVEPLFLQRCRCLERAGFPVATPEFRPVLTPAHLAGTGITRADAGTYLHLSPFTTTKRKELPPDQFIQLVAGLAEQYPGRRFVFSCAPIDQERARLAELMARLPVKPWRVFPGDLRLAQLAAVIQHSHLHASGDTGPLHLAVMTQTPSISWFFDYPGLREWLPVGHCHQSVIGTPPVGETFLPDINTNALLTAAKSALAPAPTSGILVSQ
jgi:ADP-heptose:LPS heptosyltransferase